MSRVTDLEAKIERQKFVIRQMQVAAEFHNREAFATGLIVHCTGCVAGGPEGYEGLTEERVREVEWIAERLRKWWNTNRGRIGK